MEDTTHQPAEGLTHTADGEAKLRDLATVDLMLDHIARLVDAYQAHADGLAVKLPERAGLDQALDIAADAVAIARAARAELFDAAKAQAGWR